MIHQITLNERRKQIAAYRVNPEYAAIIERIVKRFTELNQSNAAAQK